MQLAMGFGSRRFNAVYHKGSPIIHIMILVGTAHCRPWPADRLLASRPLSTDSQFQMDMWREHPISQQFLLSRPEIPLQISSESNTSYAGLPQIP